MLCVWNNVIKQPSTRHFCHNTQETDILNLYCIKSLHLKLKKKTLLKDVKTQQFY